MESTEKIYVHKEGNGVATAGLVTGVAALAGVAAKWIGNLIDGGPAPFFGRHGHVGFGHEGGERFGRLESDVHKNQEINDLKIQLASERNLKATEILAVRTSEAAKALEAQIKRLGSYIQVTPAFAAPSPGLLPEPVVEP